MTQSRHTVFLPGAAGSPEFWRPVADRLPAAWDRELLGWPGAGNQPHNPHVNCFEDLVERTTGIERLYAVIGGFHLSGPIFEPLIPAVCDAFAEMAQEVIVATHCTGWRAIQ